MGDETCPKLRNPTETFYGDNSKPEFDKSRGRDEQDGSHDRRC